MAQIRGNHATWTQGAPAERYREYLRLATRRRKSVQALVRELLDREVAKEAKRKC